jgi:orotate phosphoribosyltransferase
MEKGKGEKSALEEISGLYGFPTAAIVTMAEVTEYLYNRPYKGTVYIDEECKARIDAYYRTYGAK